MTGKTHQILGIAAGAGYYLSTTSASYNPATLGAVIAVSYISTLIPDIDQPAAKLWHSIPFGHAVGKVTSSFLDHRNLSHSFLGLGIFAMAVHYLFNSIPNYWGISPIALFSAALIAYSVHLLADMVTIEGTPLLYPYQRMFGLPPKPFEGIRIQTGKWFENQVLFPLINLLFVIGIIINLEKIKSILFK